MITEHQWDQIKTDIQEMNDQLDAELDLLKRQMLLIRVEQEVSCLLYSLIGLVVSLSIAVWVNWIV